MPPYIDIEQPGAVANAIESVRGVGLQVHSAHLPFYRNFGNPDFRFIGLGDSDRTYASIAMRLITDVISEMGGTGADLAILHAAGTTQESLDRAQERFDEDLEVVLKVAEKKGVTLALENIMTPLSSVERIASLIKRWNHPRLKACLDVGHAAISEDPIAAIRMLGEHLVTTHLHDNHGKEDDHLPLGEGVLDWGKISPALSVGCNPNLILEVSFKEIKDFSDHVAVLELLKKFFSQAKRIFNTWNLA
jgi:sugar phosphate isomerase/epimerase